MKQMMLLALAPFILAAGPIDPETSKDVQCLVAVSSIAGSDDAHEKVAALIGAQYFLGRIDGRSPDLDLEAAVTSAAARLTDTAVKELMQTCGQLMESRGAALQAIGKRMQDAEPQSSSSS